MLQLDENNFIKMVTMKIFIIFNKEQRHGKGNFVDYIEYIFAKSNDYKIISDAFPLGKSPRLQ